MADTTANLGLPLLQAAQAQKHITHNEALLILDLLVQGAVLDRDRTSPPPAPIEGQCHLVAPAATGAWAGQSGKIAAFVNNGWLFLVPRAGWRLRLLAGAEDLLFDGSVWQASAEVALKAASLGLNTSADPTNRLTVSSPATLLSHSGQGHQLKINKAGAAETASLLFQSAWSGRAEMGLAGQDDFSIKVSADGTTFTEALRFARASGLASGQAVTQSASDATAGRLLRVGAGHQQLDATLYRRGNVLGSVTQASGQPTGALIEQGSSANGDYSRFADGTQIAWVKKTLTPLANTASAVAWVFPAGFVAGQPVVVQLSADPRQHGDPTGLCQSDRHGL